MKTIGDALHAGYASLMIHRLGISEPHRLLAYPEDVTLLEIADLLARIHPEKTVGVSLTKDLTDLDEPGPDDERWLWGRRGQPSALEAGTR